MLWYYHLGVALLENTKLWREKCTRSKEIAFKILAKKWKKLSIGWLYNPIRTCIWFIRAEAVFENPIKTDVEAILPNIVL